MSDTPVPQPTGFAPRDAGMGTSPYAGRSIPSLITEIEQLREEVRRLKTGAEVIRSGTAPPPAVPWDGRPPNPDRSWYHWLRRCDVPGYRMPPVIWTWRADAGVWRSRFGDKTPAEAAETHEWVAMVAPHEGGRYAWRPIDEAPKRGAEWLVLLEPKNKFGEQPPPRVGSWHRGAWRDAVKGVLLKPVLYLELPGVYDREPPPYEE